MTGPIRREYMLDVRFRPYPLSSVNNSAKRRLKEEMKLTELFLRAQNPTCSTGAQPTVRQITNGKTEPEARVQVVFNQTQSNPNKSA